MPASTATTDDLELDAQRQRVRSRRGSVWRALFTIFIVGVVVLALFGLFGVRTRSVRAAGGDIELEVTYAQITRPGLASTWTARIAATGAEPLPDTLTVRTTRAYMEQFDENAFDPEPADEQQTEEYRVWTFEPDPGTRELVVSFDARLEPGWRTSEHATTTVLVDDEPIVSVSYRTWIVP